MTNQLSQQTCEVCRGGMPSLPEKEILELLASVSGWIREGESIKKIFTFKNFKEALAFFNKVAEIAEIEDHHPDMGIQNWKHVNLVLTTHAIKGLTRNDFIVAAKINELKS